MMFPVRRDPPSGAEIPEAKLSEMIESVLAAGEEAGPVRRAMRVPVEGFARIQLMKADAGASLGAPRVERVAQRVERVVGVYDMSRTGIAIVDSEAMTPGQQF